MMNRCVVRFEPFAQADRVHHILLYGCEYPAVDKKFWKGGETCRGGAHILYAWARNAPDLRLPAGVAFGVGHETDSIRYFVLQVHYAHPFAGKLLDYSGVTMHVMDDRPQYLAAVLLFVSGTPIPPGYAHFQTNMSCIYRGNTPLHPFAFRTHTHGMGRVVSAFYKHDGKWTMIGKRNPQWPQLFQLINANLTIAPDDLMAATCVFDSSQQTKVVEMGNTGVNEMCNFYMMFYWDATIPDPFPYGAACPIQESADTVSSEYPAEGVSLLPLHPEWEHEAHQSGKPFGYTDGIFATSIGDVKLGQVSGLSFDPYGNLVVFHRATRVWDQSSFDYANTLQDRTTIPQETILLAKPDPSGKSLILVAKYGQNEFYMPHGIFVDTNNDYFTTDVGSHQVIKWRLSNGKLEKLLALGEQFVPGSDHDHFCMPTAVTVVQDGSIFIADGYCNNRVLKFNKDGRFLAKWGEPYYIGNSAGPPALGLFSIVHDITTNSDGSLLYVCDRENARVQIFRTTGQPVGQITNPVNNTLFSTVYSAHYHDGSVYFIPGEARLDIPLRAFSAHAGSARVQFSFEPVTHKLQRPHVIRASPDGRYIYVADLGDKLGGRLIQFMYERTTDKPSEASAVAKMSSWKHEQAADSFMKPTLIVSIVMASILLVGLVRVCRRRTSRIDAKQSVLDRAGFKPLRTDDPDSSEEDSDDDTIITRGKVNHRF
uniref:Peptidylglycine monooxygenase n=1 Tax=Ascaris lumbricoides TaxID=6252 RepID=A0A9J2PRR0_ASCLU